MLLLYLYQLSASTDDIHMYVPIYNTKLISKRAKIDWVRCQRSLSTFYHPCASAKPVLRVYQLWNAK